MQDTFAQLTRWLGDRDTVLIGWSRILAYLYEIGVRRPNGRHVYQPQVLRWRAAFGFPLLRGTRNRHHSCPPCTTTFAITAWLLSQVDSGQLQLFRLYSPHDLICQSGSRAAPQNPAISAVS
jgi:hypothetical protein